MARTESDSAVTGVVLAGGRSTRFGDADTNKAATAFGERPLLGHVVDAVTESTGRQPIVAVHTAEQRGEYAELLVDRDVSFVRDAPAFEGPLAGVVGALARVDTPWLFVCGCDMPLLSPKAISWLAARLPRSTAPAERDALAAVHPDGTIEPMHTLYRGEAVEDSRESLPRTGGVRSLLRALQRVKTVPVEAAPSDVQLANSTTNVNTREELDAVADRLVE